MDSTTDNPKTSAAGSSHSAGDNGHDSPLTPLSADHPHVNRTERGLVVRGTRLTLYQLWESLLHGMPREEAPTFYRISPEQLSGAIEFIESNRAAFDVEYQSILRSAEELRKYYEEKNRERLAQIAALPPPPGQEAQYAMLQERKRKLGMK